MFNWKLPLSILTAILISGCQNIQKNPNVLQVGTCSDYPPFESRNDQNELVGYDIDLANLISQELNKKVEFVDMSFNALLNSVRSGKIDMVISSVGITDERKKQVDFSDPYFFNRLTVVSRKNMPINDEKEINNKKMGAQLGTTFVNWLKDRHFKNVITMNLSQQLIEALKAKQLDGVIIDYSQATTFCKKNPELTYHFLKRDDNGSGIVFQKDSPLRNQVNKTLEKLKKSGQMANLEKKWL